MVMSNTAQNNLPFTKQDYFQMLQNMYQPLPQPAGSSNILDQFRKAGQAFKLSGTTL